MKIGMLTDCYRPVINGITHFICLCKREMEAAGHQVWIFTYGDQDSADAEQGVVRSPGIPLADSGYYFSLTYSRQAREKLSEMDVLHAHHPFFSGRMAVRYGRRLNLPIVFTNHTRYDLYAQAYLPAVPPVLTGYYLESYMPAFARRCDLMIAPSAGLKQVLLEMGVDQEIAVIPNGIDLEPLYHPATAVSRRELDIPDDATVLIYCGRLGPEKNVDLLLQAFAGAAQAVPSAYLVLVGGGPAESSIQEQAEQLSRVRCVGQVPYEEVPAYLALADLFATASVTEVHPLSVIEALAAGLPVLGIHSPGISDTVRDTVDGFLTTHDLASFTALMVRLLLQPELRAAMAANARERSSYYDIRTCTATLLDHYRCLVDDARTRSPREELWETLVQEVRQVLGE